MLMRLKFLTLAMILVAVAAVAMACGDDDDDDGGTSVQGGPTIRFGAFDFAESHILAHIYARALREKGYSVDTSKVQPGSPREVIKPALESGQLDFVPEYVGTLLTFLGSEATSKGDDNLKQLREKLTPLKLTAFDIAPAQDTNAIVVSKRVADQHNLKKVSDLARVDDQLRFGAPAECPQRKFCAIGLKDVYGIEFGRFVPLAFGARVTALAEGAIDVALLFSTDAVIITRGFVLLEDDKNLQPAENIVPVVRNEIADRYGASFRDVVNDISKKITTAKLTDLNKQVQEDKKDPDAVAAEWLKKEGLIK
jgi:osmoprotectant transport system substrate-binding protein